MGQGSFGLQLPIILHGDGKEEGGRCTMYCVVLLIALQVGFRQVVLYRQKWVLDGSAKIPCS